jgi:hypothetical protein
VYDSGHIILIQNSKKTDSNVKMACKSFNVNVTEFKYS